MKIKAYIILAFLMTNCCLLTSCSSEDTPAKDSDFVVAFKDASESFSEDSSDLTIELLYSETATENGHIEIRYTTENIHYGTDFTTSPSMMETSLNLPVKQGTSGTSFVLNKLIDALPNEEKSVTFSIVEVQVGAHTARTQGNTSTTVFFNPTAALGASLAPDMGGPNEPNQVYVHLSTKKETAIQRDTWDLGFYSEEDFRVKLNSSIYMFAAALDHTDIDQVSETHIGNLKTKMDFLVEGSDVFVDDPTGDITKTAIKEISENDEDNPVYVLKMGYKVGTETPDNGGVAVTGEARGYKKIRILRRGEEYLLQYAALNDNTHQEVILSKATGFNFNFFSFDTESIVNVEPEKYNWDLNFTVKTETQELPDGGRTAYGFSDYVEINTLNNVQAYRVSTNLISYEDYKITHVQEEDFERNQQVIGSSWRVVTPPDREVYSNIFYVLKDADGNYYKIKFLSLLNENGVRGYPEFKYELLQ